MRTSIRARPQEVNERSVGHVEGDTIEGRRSVGDGIHTEVEPKTGKVFATKVTALISAVELIDFLRLEVPAVGVTSADGKYPSRLESSKATVSCRTPSSPASIS